MKEAGSLVLLLISMIAAASGFVPQLIINRNSYRTYLQQSFIIVRPSSQLFYQQSPSNSTDANVFDYDLSLIRNPKEQKLTMIGAGPGDPELLTVKAHKLLQEEDALVVADRLISDEVLALIKSKDVKIARKHPGCAEQAQKEIYNWCYQGLIEQKHVIRLKIGDPFVFGRGGEEVLEFRKMGVEPVVVPGVSAAFSAPLLGGIPVTHRGYANQVVMCTGYGRNGTSPELIQYHKEQTVVFLMAVGRLRELCDNLCNLANYPRHTPVGIIERAGCPDQRTLVGDMNTIADLALKHNIKAPSTIVVGSVVNVLLNGGELTEQALLKSGLIQTNAN